MQAYNLSVVGAETRGSLELAACQPSSRFRERTLFRGIKGVVIGQDTGQPPLTSTIDHGVWRKPSPHLGIDHTYSIYTQTHKTKINFKKDMY